MKGFLLLIGSIAGGFVIGSAVTAILSALTVDADLASMIGTSVWLLSIPTLLAYASLWFTDPREIAYTPEPKSHYQEWRATKRENKLWESEVRFGMIFAIIGGITADMANAHHLVTMLVAIGCATIGGLIGFDFKRRVYRIRERLATKVAPYEG